jgi:hypothetical protein
MGLSTMLAWFGQPVDIVDDVAIVTRQAEPEVLKRTELLGGSMAANQRRGYVEARSTKVVRRHVDRLATLRSLDAKTKQRLLDASLESVVDAICRQLEVAQPTVLRIAA